jgi:hypothetical protein
MILLWVIGKLFRIGNFKIIQFIIFLYRRIGQGCILFLLELFGNIMCLIETILIISSIVLINIL